MARTKGAKDKEPRKKKDDKPKKKTTISAGVRKSKDKKIGLKIGVKQA